MARRRNSRRQQQRRRMTWFYRAKTMGKQAEEKPKPVAYYFEPDIADHFKGVKQSETTSYFEIDLVDKLRAKKETNESK